MTTHVAKIYLDDPNIGTKEKEYLNRCIDSSFVSTYGPFVPEFEENFSRLLGASGAVALQSGTAGLHMALHELGIGSADEVILPVLTFIATANAVTYSGARPVFADVDPSTWNLDPEQVERAITEKTKAIIPVHLYGNPCDMSAIMSLAEKYHLRVVEDATESLGSKFDGKFTGTFGDFGVFSFNGNKLMTTGGGGMIIGADEKRLRHIKYLANQARDGSDAYSHSELGFNYRMTNLEAALGLAQMERLGEFIASKKAFAGVYGRIFAPCEGLSLQRPYAQSDVVPWLTSVELRDIAVSVAQLQAELQAREIPTRRIFRPLFQLAPYRENQRRYPNACRIFESGLTLPGSTLNTEEVIERAARQIVSLAAKRVCVQPSRPAQDRTDRARPAQQNYPGCIA